MKKNYSLFVILIITLLNCSSDDDSTTSSQIQINPPNWIQGEWLQDDNFLGDTGWRFTNDDFIIILTGNESSQRDQLEIFLDAGQDVSAQDEITNDTYEVISNFPAGQTTTYSFTKISDTEIMWDSSSNAIYTKQ